MELIIAHPHPGPLPSRERESGALYEKMDLLMSEFMAEGQQAI